MKYVVTFAISGLHNTCLPKKKPFNPILGEVRDLEHSFRPHRRNLCAKLHAQQHTHNTNMRHTHMRTAKNVPRRPVGKCARHLTLPQTFEAKYPDGTEICCEQTSHHPPVTSWQVHGPQGAYHFYGFGEWSAHFSVNSVTGYAHRPSMLTYTYTPLYT